MAGTSAGAKKGWMNRSRKGGGKGVGKKGGSAKVAGASKHGSKIYKGDPAYWGRNKTNVGITKKGIKSGYSHGGI